MSLITLKQTLVEIIADYRYNLAQGMSDEDSLGILKMMVVEMIEFEKSQSFDFGHEVGAYKILNELRVHGPEYVISKYEQLGEEL